EVDSGKFELYVDAPGFKDDELSVSIRAGIAVDQGKQVSIDPKYGPFSSEFVKKFPVPEKVDLDKLTDVVKKDGGCLKIEGPFKQVIGQGLNSGDRVIPIVMYNSISAQTDAPTNAPTDAPTDAPTAAPT